jgi:hypothetical protein
MKKDAWHSIAQSVHHNNTSCDIGSAIELESRKAGTGGKPLCAECAKLNSQGK